MIDVFLVTDGGLDVHAGEMKPAEIKEYIDLIKDHGAWYDYSQYHYIGAVYNIDRNSFDITIK